MTQEALKLALEALELSTDWDVNATGKQLKSMQAITALRKALAQLEQEQEHDNSATHLAHCYQGEYPVCKYGDENCPATPKVKTHPEQEYESVLIDGVAYTIPSKVAVEILGLHLDLLQLKQEQEPVAWYYPGGSPDQCTTNKAYAEMEPAWIPLYTTPPQRKFVGLTDDEMEATFIECGGKWNGDFWKIEDADFHPFLRTIEAKLKQKNGFAEKKNT